ncbi:MAG TPA: class I SAM-dependent methyltransferase [Oligoflexia bacterium]|nr:class I SAM-dependent methyltransferase [Oligoflexia bacterium]HMP49797.1 class I SAM-dependent methyltransferase [Oligoflexia bacterium]
MLVINSLQFAIRGLFKGSFVSKRTSYKETWNALSSTLPSALAHVCGRQVSEAEFYLSGVDQAQRLINLLDVGLDDVVLEIGCGPARLGVHLAPICKEWIGCDVSEKMIEIAYSKVQGLSNVKLLCTSGFDLETVASNSVDVVYSTVVFMHLDSWDRYQYLLEAYRILKLGGRLYCDNLNLCSDEGWSIFLEHAAYRDGQRPNHISECSTPDEFKAYASRIGFTSIEVSARERWLEMVCCK